MAYPTRMEKSLTRKRNFRRTCLHRFTVENNMLFYVTRKGTVQRVLKTGEWQNVLASVHESSHGGHLGVNKTWTKIAERYYWKGSFDAVWEFISKCDQCQKKDVLKKAKKPLQSIPVSDTAFSQIGMDIVGPLEKTEKGNRYLLVFTEYLTKWVESYPLSVKSADAVLCCFVDFVSRHGVPDTLITDQGREFCNKLNIEFCDKMGIDHRVASPYHPQTGGQTERFNKTLCTMLSALANKDQNDWDVQLPYVLFAYRTAQHKSTKCDPFSLVYGRKAVLPIEVSIPVSKKKVSCEDDDLKKRIQSFIQLSAARKDAGTNIRKAQANQKKYYDVGTTAHMFKVGDRVLLHNTRRLTRKGGKLTKRWSGPYLIEAVLKKGTYRLAGKNTVFNGDRIKAYKEVGLSDASFNSPQPKQKPFGDSHGLSDASVTAPQPKQMPFGDSHGLSDASVTAPQPKQKPFGDSLGLSDASVTAPQPKQKTFGNLHGLSDASVTAPQPKQKPFGDSHELSDASVTPPQPKQKPFGDSHGLSDASVTPPQPKQKSCGDSHELSDASVTAPQPKQKPFGDLHGLSDASVTPPQPKQKLFGDSHWLSDASITLHPSKKKIINCKSTESAKFNEESNKLPLKKRKEARILRNFESEEVVDNKEPIIVGVQEPKPLPFRPVGSVWQKENASHFGIGVKNYHKIDSSMKEMKNSSKPIKKISMRGDGNCLFRALSYMLFGMYHVIVRDYILKYMQEVGEVQLKSYSTYITETKMNKYGTWGSENEILAFAAMTKTAVYIYSQHGLSYDGQPIFCWLQYSPPPTSIRMNYPKHVCI